MNSYLLIYKLLERLNYKKKSLNLTEKPKNKQQKLNYNTYFVPSNHSVMCGRFIQNRGTGVGVQGSWSLVACFFQQGAWRSR